MENVSQAARTEELLTCLQIKFFNPQQDVKDLYKLLPLRNRCTQSADDPLRLGRDAKACTLALNDLRVSRKQLAIQAYRVPESTDMLFTIQNQSQKGKLFVNGSSLGYLERMDLPDKVLVRFGEYEMLIIRDSGEAKAEFELDLEVLMVPPSRETCLCAPSMTPVMDTGMNGFAAIVGPLENDETLSLHSS